MLGYRHDDIGAADQFTFNRTTDTWSWRMSTSECNNTYVQCDWEIPNDTQVPGVYVVVAIRNATNGMAVTTVRSDSFAVVASSAQTTLTATASSIPLLTGARASAASELPTENTAESFQSDEISNMSPGAQAGVAVGSVAILLALAGLLWFCCRRRRNRKKVAAATMVENDGENCKFEKPELDGQPLLVNEKIVVEMKNNSIALAELDSEQPWRHNNAAPVPAEAMCRVDKITVAEIG
nr:uncharacterized protein CTRU02_11783 [Colletotrichum truncatum]KAF6785483.1 hypothetical protein CTRU02_11783 [Colletotrichum truncatum]